MRSILTIRHLLLATTMMVLLAALVAGCAKQDLYEPPGSPYEVVGRLHLPSINEAVAVMGHTAFIAGGEAGLHSIDWTDPSSPVLLSTINTTKYADDIQVVRTFTGGALRDIAHLVEGTEGVTSFEVTNPSAPYDFNTGQTAIVGRTIFITQPEDPDEPYVVYMADDWKGLRIFESFPDTPGILAYNGVFVGTNGKAYGLAVRDGWGYVADNEMGICVIDLRVLDLNEVELVSWADTPGTARAIALEGDYAYVADGVEGLSVFRIHEGDTPERVAVYDLSGFSEGIAVRDGLCALAANGGGVHFMDVSEPSNPIYLGTTVTSYAADVVFADDGHCLVADEDDGLIVLGGRGPFRDETPPAPIPDLLPDPTSVNSFDLMWTMTGDNRFYGIVSSLEIRMADFPITDEDSWNAATPVLDVPTPEPAGTRMTLPLDSFERDQTYHFAARSTDGEGHVSELSNAAPGTTLNQIKLRNGSVTPRAGSIIETFTYEVEVLWGLPLTSAEVLIDGAPNAMSPGDGRYYRFETTGLLPGEHEYSFWFTADTSADAVFPVDGTAAFGPVVGSITTFMGSPEDEPGRSDNEPLHEVVLGTAVVASPYEVTQAEWDEIMDAGMYPNPSEHVGSNRPVDSVPWLDAIAYCNARSQADGLTPAYTVGSGFDVTWNRIADGWRLPTEAEWEYLCRADSDSALYNNANLTELNCRLDDHLDAIGWYCGNSPYGPVEVGQKEPNANGLYDMSGNLREWCWDWYEELSSEPAFDMGGPPTGELKLSRGGSWIGSAQDCRTASRRAVPPDSADDTIGFRVVRSDFTR